MKTITDFINESANKILNINQIKLADENFDEIPDVYKSLKSKYSKNKFIEIIPNSDLYDDLLDEAPEHADFGDPNVDDFYQIGEEEWVAVYKYENKKYLLDFTDLWEPIMYLMK